MDRVARMTIRVMDLGRSVNFYTRKLGFRLAGTPGERFALLEGMGLTILLHRKFEQQPDRSQSGTISIGIQVDDVNATRAELESRGVLFEGETVEADGMKIAFTSDPDDVPIFIVETSAFGS